MVIDNFVEAAKTFLSCFNLKLENKKTNELSNYLLSCNSLNVLDYNNSIVGNIYVNGIYYYINVMLEDKILSVTVYKNEKEASTFNFKYYINDPISFKNVLKGFYTSRKSDKGKIIHSNEYRIPGTGFVKKECTFDSLNKSYEIIDKRYGYSCNMKNGVFEFKGPLYSLVIRKYPNNIYCEKIYNSLDENDIYNFDLYEKDGGTDSFIGYEVDWNTTSFESEVNKIVEYLSPEYYVFIKKFKSFSDKTYPNLFYNTVNATIKDSQTRRLFKLKSTSIKEDSGSSKQKKRKKRKNKKS